MAPGEMLVMLAVAATGALVASVLSLVPALHIYNVAGFIILATATLGEFVPPESLAFFFLGLITSYSDSLTQIAPLRYRPEGHALRLVHLPTLPLSQRVLE